MPRCHCRRAPARPAQGRAAIEATGTGTATQLPERRAEGLLYGLLIALLVAAGAVAWLLQLRTPPAVDVAPLAGFPERLGVFRSQDAPLDQEVERILRADYNLSRTYYGPDGAPVALYIGYYGTARGGRPEHTPRFCYTGAGWGIEQARVVDLGGGRAVRVNEWRVERDGDRRLVQFWYRSYRHRSMVGGLELTLDKLAGRLFDGRGDGALVRVSTPVGDDEAVARARLRQFASAVDEGLDAHWPLERTVH